MSERRSAIDRSDVTAEATAPSNVPDVPERVVAGVRKALGEHLRAVVLFGSRARNDSHPSSDWDVLVIADHLPEAVLDRYRVVKTARPPGIRAAAAILAVTSSEFEANLPELYLDIALDGRSLFDDARYAADRLGQLRRIIDRAGLYRARTPTGYEWRWKEPPAGRWSIEWEHLAVGTIAGCSRGQRLRG